MKERCETVETDHDLDNVTTLTGWLHRLLGDQLTLNIELMIERYMSFTIALTNSANFITRG